MRRIHRLPQCIAQFVVVLAMLCGSAFPGQQVPDPYGVYNVGNGVTPPKPVFMPNPEYTDNARKKKINGTVLVAMIVTQEGTVRDAKVVKSLEKGLDQQALATVSTWKFEPATKDGKPVAVHLNIDVSFHIH
jgi:TonB family protein